MGNVNVCIGQTQNTGAAGAEPLIPEPRESLGMRHSWSEAASSQISTRDLQEAPGQGIVPLDMEYFRSALERRG